MQSEESRLVLELFLLISEKPKLKCEKIRKSIAATTDHKNVLRASSIKLIVQYGTP